MFAKEVKQLAVVTETAGGKKIRRDHVPRGVPRNHVHRRIAVGREKLRADVKRGIRKIEVVVETDCRQVDTGEDRVGRSGRNERRSGIDRAGGHTRGE